MTTVTVKSEHLTRNRNRRSVFDWVVSLMLAVVFVLMAAPLVWLVVQSLTVPAHAFGERPNWIPHPFTLNNFSRIFSYIPFGRMALNSVIVGAISTVGSLFVSVLAAYSFSRIKFRGSRILFVALLSSLMIPVQLVVIPVFVMMRIMDLTDTLTSVWLPALINVFAIFFLKNYFDSIPRDLDEAARLDGAGHVRICFRIIVPLSGPALSALTILTFEASWNNYFWPLIFLSSHDKMTLPLGLVTLGAGQSGSSVVVFAAVTLVVFPVLILFLFFQRSFVESVATAGLRG